VPFVNVKCIEGVFSVAEKKELIRKITDAVVSVEGERMREGTWVVIEEIKSGDWGEGGKSWTTADIKALQAGKSPT
jgi:4-oxalocrotonate tautomerase